MMNKVNVILMGIVGLALGLLFLGVDYTLSIRDKLALASDQVTELDTTLKLQSALTKSMTAVSAGVIKSKQDLQDDENNTKQIVRTIIKTSDCTNTLVPESASNRLREYADRIRNDSSTN